jgi:poly(ADP-ribose) glycohydrolase ARH3
VGLVEWTDKVAGLLLGTALGDAVGRPFEGTPHPAPAAVRQAAETDAILTWTDDTAMSIALTEWLIASGNTASDEDTLVAFFADAWQREPWRGYGSGPPRIFAAHLEGRSWREAASSLFGAQGSFGNGGAMRVSPVAVVAQDMRVASRLARTTASVTHAHPLAQDGAAVQSAAAYVALRQDPTVPLDRVAFLSSVMQAVETSEFGEALLRIGEMHDSAEPRQIVSELGNGIEAVRSVPTALACFLLHCDDPARALVTAVSCGGDADTIAAMTGALAGARCGQRALPQQWTSRLELVDRLHELGRALAQRAVL